MEITTLIGCKVQCKFCPQELLMNKYQEKNKTEKITWGKPVLMEYDTFKTCIDKIPKNVDIHFSGYAESWLNPDCTRMLLYAYEQGHDISVFSVLEGMTTKDVDLIKHIPFAKFEIHLPEIQNYAKIAVNAHYLEVLKKIISCNIHHLCYMSMGDLPLIIQEVIGTNFPPNLMIDRAGNSEHGKKTQQKYGPLLCSRASENGINTLDQNVLLPNGDVCLCAMDYGYQYVLGNLITSDYKSLFNSIAFKNIKEKMSSEDSYIMCRFCNLSIPAKNANNTNLISKSRPELNEKYVRFIENLFDELLFRPPKEVEIHHFHNKLVNKELNEGDVRKLIINCKEHVGKMMTQKSNYRFQRDS